MKPVELNATCDWPIELNNLLTHGDLIPVQSNGPVIVQADLVLASELYTVAFVVANYLRREISNINTFHYMLGILIQHFDFQCHANKSLILISTHVSSLERIAEFTVSRPLGIPLKLKVELEKENIAVGVFAGNTFLIPTVPPYYATKYSIKDPA